MFLLCCVLTFVLGKHSNILILVKLTRYSLIHKGHVYTSRRAYLSRKQGEKSTSSMFWVSTHILWKPKELFPTLQTVKLLLVFKD